MMAESGRKSYLLGKCRMLDEEKSNCLGPKYWPIVSFFFRSKITDGEKTTLPVKFHAGEQD